MTELQREVERKRLRRDVTGGFGVFCLLFATAVAGVLWADEVRMQRWHEASRPAPTPPIVERLVTATQDWVPVELNDLPVSLEWPQHVTTRQEFTITGLRSDSAVNGSLSALCNDGPANINFAMDDIRSASGNRIHDTAPWPKTLPPGYCQLFVRDAMVNRWRLVESVYP